MATSAEMAASAAWWWAAGLTGASSIDIGATGNAYVGRFTGGTGNPSLADGSQLRAGLIHIGGNSDNAAGGVGYVSVRGAGSELRAHSTASAGGFVRVGRGGVGSLDVNDQGKVSAMFLHVGRAAGRVCSSMPVPSMPARLRSARSACSAATWAR